MARITRDLEDVLAKKIARPVPRETSGRASAWIAWAPLVVLPVTVVLLREIQSAWLFMWTFAFALFAACKWLTWYRACAVAGCPASVNSFAYLCGWVGMDAAAFLHVDPAVRRPALREWIFALAKTALGIVLFWGVARHCERPLTAAWVGMVGIIFVLHFGTFHLLALAWRLHGFAATPLMRAPILAPSLSEFWNTRWNAAFHTLAKQLMFAPLVRVVGARGALFGTFVASGIVHDLIISLPAGGGFGKPTLYFVLQGLGVLIERSRTGARLGLRAGWRARLFMVVVTAAPVGMLFHRPFIDNVMLPFMEVMGAL